MIRPKLPKKRDLENQSFHPVLKYVLETLILRNELPYVVVEQFQSGSGPIDLILQHKHSKRTLLPIEVKRTKEHVRGSGRRQARDYINNLGPRSEGPFYCVSNLELTELLRNDQRKPLTSSHLVSTSSVEAGQLEATDEDEFYSNLESIFQEILEIVLGRINWTYKVGLEELQVNLDSMLHIDSDWHKMLMPICFEYIRGASNNTLELREQTKKWNPANFYAMAPGKIKRLGGNIDFEQIFSDPIAAQNCLVAFSPSVLQEAYSAGKELGNGEDLAVLISEVLSKTPDALGIVETDSELALLLAIVGVKSLKNPAEVRKVIDPCAGSGRLLSALSRLSLPIMSPDQLIAIEKEVKFAEALSLRLGLSYPSQISPSNRPKILMKDFLDVDNSIFDNVELVLMNPPFISGVASKKLKEQFITKFKELAGQDSYFLNGQSALEILFLENVVTRSAVGTVIAVIFPTLHLFRKSDDASRLRKFLIEKFGITHIVRYPRQGLFNSVIKDTLILVGIKGSTNKCINFFDVQSPLSNIDFDNFYSQFESSESDIDYTSSYSIEIKDLEEGLDTGWREHIGSGIRINELLGSVHIPLEKLGNLPKIEMKRGTMANKGNSDLVVLSRARRIAPAAVSLLPNSWIYPALNNSSDLPNVLDKLVASEQTFIPPSSAYIANTKEAQLLNKVVDEYNKAIALKPLKGKQKKNRSKSTEQIISDLKSDQRVTNPTVAIIPRASRRSGSISIIREKTFVFSSNFFMVRFETESKTRIFASYMASVFGQLQLEFLGVNESGMRKLEKGSLSEVKIPNFNFIAPEKAQFLIELFEDSDFHDLSDPKILPLDRAWADVLSESPHEKAALLSLAYETFGYLVDERTLYGNST